MRRFSPRTDTGLVFPNCVGKPMDANNLCHRDWKKLLKRAGLADQEFTFHALRHAFATTLLRQNVNPKIVQHQLGRLVAQAARFLSFREYCSLEASSVLRVISVELPIAPVV